MRTYDEQMPIFFLLLQFSCPPRHLQPLSHLPLKSLLNLWPPAKNELNRKKLTKSKATNQTEQNKNANTLAKINFQFKI